jgi:hypothetical protein
MLGWIPDDRALTLFCLTRGDVPCNHHELSVMSLAPRCHSAFGLREFVEQRMDRIDAEHEIIFGG